MNIAGLDQNSRRTLSALSSVDNTSIVNCWADPVTHRLLVDLAGGNSYTGTGSITINGSNQISLVNDSTPTASQYYGTNGASTLGYYNLPSAGTGTVTTVSVVTANGISGSVATATTTPAITLSLGAITPSTVNGLTLASQAIGFTIAGGTTSKTLTVPLDASVSGTNTGDNAANSTYTIGSQTQAYNANLTSIAALANASGALVNNGSGTFSYSAIPSVGNWGALNYPTWTTGTPFVKMTAAGTFALDTSTYLTSLSGAVLTDQTVGQTIGATGARLTKLWATDITVTNAIAGSVTGTSANVTGIVAPANGGTGIANNAAMTVTGSGNYAFTRTLTGATNMTFPAVTDTVAVLGTNQTYTNQMTEQQVIWTQNTVNASGNAYTVPITYRLTEVTNNSAAGLTITLTTTSAVDGQMIIVKTLPSSNVAQTITWVNTENSAITPNANLNASTTSPTTDGFMFNSGTTKWRCIASC